MGKLKSVFEHKAIGADIAVDLIGFKTKNIKEIIAMNVDCVVISCGHHVD